LKGIYWAITCKPRRSQGELRNKNSATFVNWTYVTIDMNIDKDLTPAKEGGGPVGVKFVGLGNRLQM
jgi:hypothetical protein